MLKTLTGILVLVILTMVLWRFASRRYVLPCPTWLGWLVEMDNPFTKINRAATIIQHLDLKPNMVVLDAGSGPGRLTIPLAKKVPQGHVVAMDIQQGMLDKVRDKAQSLGLQNISFHHAGIGDNTLKENTFDRVALVTVLGEIPHQEAALKEIFFALKPGGILSVTEIIFDPHFQRRSTVDKLAQSVGFQEKRHFGNFFAYTLHLEKPANQ